MNDKEKQEIATDAKNEKLDLNKLESKDGILTIIHQHLNAPQLEKLHEEESVSLEGTISAPGNFFTKRTEEIKTDKSHVKYCYRDKKITLITIEDYSNLGSEIVGKLVVNPAFVELGINTTKMFSVSELTKHIRMNKFYFESKEQHAKIVSTLQNFNAKANAEIKKVNDGRGNLEDLYKVSLESNAELNFQVKTPVFIGQDEKSINVEIGCMVDNSNVKFWLESPDLIELTEKDTKSIIDKELERFDQKLVFIEQ